MPQIYLKIKSVVLLVYALCTLRPQNPSELGDENLSLELEHPGGLGQVRSKEPIRMARHPETKDTYARHAVVRATLAVHAVISLTLMVCGRRAK